MFRVLLIASLFSLPAGAALHLMFPFDYLSLSEDERRYYLVGVLDTRLAPLRSAERLEWLGECVTTHGIGGIQDVLENEVIPAPHTATIPMPYLVERALTQLCGAPGK